MCDMFQSWEIRKRYSWLNIVKGIHSYVLHQSYSEFWHTHSSVYSSIFRYIQAYSALLCIDMFRHVETLLRNIQAHSSIFSLTLASRVTYSQPCHIPSPGILWTGSIFKTLWTFDQASSETCHSENSLFRHYQTIFSIFGIFCNPRICRNPEHLEFWNIQNSSIIASWRTFRTLSDLQK